MRPMSREILTLAAPTSRAMLPQLENPHRVPLAARDSSRIPISQRLGSSNPISTTSSAFSARGSSYSAPAAAASMNVRSNHVPPSTSQSRFSNAPVSSSGLVPPTSALSNLSSSIPIPMRTGSLSAPSATPSSSRPLNSERVKKEPEDIFFRPMAVPEIIDLTLDDDTPEPESRDFDPRSYVQLPDTHTIIVHDTYNLPALGIVINTLLKCVVCIECGEGIDPSNICDHAAKHNPHHSAPPSIVGDLTREFGLVTMQHVAYPDHLIRPVFGIPIDPEPLVFCGACHRGFHGGAVGLKNHQSNMGRCNVLPKDRTSYAGYGQILTKGPHKRFFPVDISVLDRRPSNPPKYSQIFQDTMPPPFDYSTMPVQDVDDHQNIGSFLFREGWLDVVKGYSAVEILEAVRLPDPETEPWGKALQRAAHRYMAHVQPVISRNHGFGLTEAIAQLYASYVLY